MIFVNTLYTDTHALLNTIGLDWCQIIMHLYNDR